MQLTGYTPPERGGDRLPAKDAVDRPLVVQVREHRSGIVTKFKPDGGDGVSVDVADVASDSVWCDVLWMNGAIVDGLAPFVGQALPIKLVWTPAASGGNPFIGVSPLEGSELTQAQTWAGSNTNRFETERVQRQQQSGAQSQAPAQPSAPPATVAQQQPQQQPQPQAPAQPAAASGDPNDPATQALLQQINNGNPPPSA